MKEHRDTINRLSIELDEDPERFEVYADQLKNRLQARLVQKLDFDDLRCWAYDVAGVMVELYWDDATGQGILIRMMDEEDEERLREVEKTIIEG